MLSLRLLHTLGLQRTQRADQLRPRLPRLDDIVDVPQGLPAPVLPNIEDVVFLLIPAKLEDAR